MAFSETELHQIDVALTPLINRVPEHIREQLRIEYTVAGHSIVMDEVRPHFRDPSEVTRLPIAKFQFVRTRSLWKLFWKRASGKWQGYEPHAESTSLSQLVKTVQDDKLGCFFG